MKITQTTRLRRFLRSTFGASVMVVMLLALPFTIQSAAPTGLYPQTGEALYLMDSCQSPTCPLVDEHTHIYRVLIDETIPAATLVEIGLTYNFAQVDTAGTTIDGKKLYLVSKWGGGVGNGRMGYLDLQTGAFKNPDHSLAQPLPDPSAVFVKEGGVMVPGVIMGAFSPNNTFFVGSQITDELYRLDVVSGMAHSLGVISVDGGAIDLLGADIAFTADGRMFLWTNESPKGLYEISMGPPLVAQYVGNSLLDPDIFITGLAFRSNGFFQNSPAIGELAGSTCCDYITVFDLDGNPSTITDTNLFPMLCDCGSPQPGEYDYTYGDMASGALGSFPCVHTIGYWKNHDWEYVAGIPTGVQICGIDIFQELGQDLLKAKSRNFSMLTAQLIGAKLNTSGGAGLAIVSDAEAFLCDATGGQWDMPFTDKDQKAQANQYKDALDAFNNGSAISMHCD